MKKDRSISCQAIEAQERSFQSTIMNFWKHKKSNSKAC